VESAIRDAREVGAAGGFAQPRESKRATRAGIGLKDAIEGTVSELLGLQSIDRDPLFARSNSESPFPDFAIDDAVWVRSRDGRDRNTHGR